MFRVQITRPRQYGDATGRVLSAHNGLLEEDSPFVKAWRAHWDWDGLEPSLSPHEGWIILCDVWADALGFTDLSRTYLVDVYGAKEAIPDGLEHRTVMLAKETRTDDEGYDITGVAVTFPPPSGVTAFIEEAYRLLRILAETSPVVYAVMPSDWDVPHAEDMLNEGVDEMDLDPECLP